MTITIPIIYSVVAMLKCSSSMAKAHLHYMKTYCREGKIKCSLGNCRIRQSFVRCFGATLWCKSYRQRLVLIWTYYASSMRSASEESVILGVITSCEWCVWKLLRLGNLESRCGFSYYGLRCRVGGIWHVLRVGHLVRCKPEVWNQAVIGVV